MDSQITLCDLSSTATSSTGHIVLGFSVDDVHNTTAIIRGGSHPIYVVESTRDASVTEIYRIEGGSEPVLVALIERKNIVPDKVTFAKGKTIRVGNFLKSSALSRFPATMKAGDREYIWKRNLIDQLIMFAEDDTSKPRAWFCKSERRVVGGQLQVVNPAYLRMENEVAEVMDLVFVACIILEHTVRMLAKASGVAA